MKKSLLFIIATATLITGISCSDDNTGCDPTGDELGVLDKNGHDIYGVGVWTPEVANFTNYYSLIENIISEKRKLKSISYLTQTYEDTDVRWSCSVPIIEKQSSFEWVDLEGGCYLHQSAILVDLTSEPANFCIEAIVRLNDRSVRRFQTIPVMITEIRYDAFTYTFGTPLDQMENLINFSASINSPTLKTVQIIGSDSPIDYLGFTDYQEQKLNKLYCTASGKNQIDIDTLKIACDKCQIPEKPCFELQPGTTNRYRVLNPQQWEINGLRCTLENTTWRQLGASDDTDDTEFACLTIEK